MQLSDGSRLVLIVSCCAVFISDIWDLTLAYFDSDIKLLMNESPWGDTADYHEITLSTRDHFLPD